jgi:hypothetical protein
VQSDTELLKYKDHILQHTNDGEKGFDEYLKTVHVNIITDNSICLYIILEKCTFLYYLEAYNKQGFRECRKTGLKLYEDYTVKQGLPVFYTGVSNLFKNNSMKIEEDLWMFIPKKDN